MAWIRARFCKLQKGCTRLAAASYKVYQLLAHDRWFSQGTPASSTTTTGRHDIAEILLKVALKKPKSNQLICRSFIFVYDGTTYSYIPYLYTLICRCYILLYACPTYTFMPFLYTLLCKSYMLLYAARIYSYMPAHYTLI
jgi:hypothetical protein